MTTGFCPHRLVSEAGGGLDDTATLALVLVMSVTVTLLGPGAYSVDARLFGRRVTVVPPRKEPDRL